MRRETFSIYHGEAVVSKTDSLCSLGAHILGEGVGRGERRKEGDSHSDRARERRRRSHMDEGSK